MAFTLGTSQLALYNKALVHLGERRLGSLTEQREPRRILDGLWNDAVVFCLGQGLWRFAKRVSQVDSSVNLTPAFGYNYAFALPNDWIRTVVVSSSPNLDPPLAQYFEEAGFIYANSTPIYLSYISIDDSYGGNMGKWPASFVEYVGYRLASQAAGKIPGTDGKAAEMATAEKNQKRNAKGTDAMNDPPGQPPLSQLVRSRLGAFGPGIRMGSGSTE